MKPAQGSLRVETPLHVFGISASEGQEQWDSKHKNNYFLKSLSFTLEQSSFFIRMDAVFDVHMKQMSFR